MNHQHPFAVTVLIVFLLTAFCLLPSVFSQSATATLSGSVTDQNGAVVPSVNLTVTNKGTGQARHATTDDSGNFTVPLLPPGAYSVGAQRDGFAPVRIESVVLNVGDQKALKIELKAGDVNAQVQVVSEAPLINESPAVATTIDRQFVGNLPLNGRSFQSLMLLTPGVTLRPSSDLNPGQFSVNGQRGNANYFTVDGVSANVGVSSSFFDFSQQQAGTVPGLTAFGGTNNLVSVDALEEFKIQTSTYSAEFGRQPGGQVSLVTRSGTNDFHGSMFEYLRNEAFDANDWFANSRGLKRAPLRQNQFGGTFSGPLMLPRFGEGGKGYWSGRDRTFLFFSYEGQRLRLPVGGVAQVPSLRVRQEASPAVRQLLNAFPLPNGAEVRNASGQPLGYSPLTLSFSNPQTLDASSLRIDHMITRKLALFGRFNYSPSSSTTRFLNQLSVLSENALTTKTLTAGVTMLLSTHVNNELRLNYSSNRARSLNKLDNFSGALPVDLSVLVSGFAGTRNRIGGASFSFSGLSSTLNVSQGDQVDSLQRQFNVVDVVSLVKGNHVWKFGIDYRRLAPVYGPVEYQQSVNFANEAATRNGTANLFIQASQGARPLFSNLSAFAQDTWKMTSQLTFDLGLRWEVNPAPGEANGIRPVLVGGIDNVTNLSTARLLQSGEPIYKTSWRAFAPRVGAAYQLRHEQGSETVLRGGFGVYYDLGSGSATAAFGGFPFQATASFSNVAYPISPTLIAPPPFAQVTLPITTTLRALNPNLKLPYTLQWSFSLQQSLGTRQTLTASYVASAGRRLLTNSFLNQRQFISTGPRPNPNFGQINMILNGPTSDYHSLQLQYQRRLSNGLQALANYTWSHAIDEISDEVSGISLTRGNANFDVRHNLSAAITYAVPAVRAGTIFTPILRNWSLNAIVHAQSGQPVDIVGGFRVLEDGSLLRVRPDVITGVPLTIEDPTVPGGRRFNTAAFQAPPNIPGTTAAARPGTFGRNVLTGLALYQVDISLLRRFKLSERFEVLLSSDAFNVFNHPNFGSYGTGFQSPSTFGVPTSMLNRSLGGLSSLYQIGGPRSMQFSLKLKF